VFLFSAAELQREGIDGRNVLRAVIRDPSKYVAAQRWLSPEARPAAAKQQNR